MAGASSAAHLSVAVVEGVHLALRSPVQEGRVAAGVVLDHARMQILNRLCLHGSPGTQSAQWSELSPAAPVITGFPGLGCIYLSTRHEPIRATRFETLPAASTQGTFQRVTGSGKQLTLSSEASRGQLGGRDTCTHNQRKITYNPDIMDPTGVEY